MQGRSLSWVYLEKGNVRLHIIIKIFFRCDLGFHFTKVIFSIKPIYPYRSSAGHFKPGVRRHEPGAGRPTACPALLDPALVTCQLWSPSDATMDSSRRQIFDHLLFECLLIADRFHAGNAEGNL